MPVDAAWHAAVIESRTSRCCCLSVATTVLLVATTRAPGLLCVPKRPVRPRTPGRRARSAAVLVGALPSTRTQGHNASARVRPSRQPPAGWATLPVWPALRHRATAHRTGRSALRHAAGGQPPSRTRCHRCTLGRAGSRRAAPTAGARPPRSSRAAQARRRGAQQPCRHRVGDPVAARQRSGTRLPQHRAPTRACATLAPRDRRTAKPGPQVGTAPHNPARVRPARQPVASQGALGCARPSPCTAGIGVARACTGAPSRCGIVPRRLGRPHRAALTSGVVRFDR